MASKTRYVYALRDPTSKEVQYVGVTTNIKRRCEEHASPSRPCAAWIASVRAAGLSPITEILESLTEGWREREKFYIRQFQPPLNKQGTINADPQKSRFAAWIDTLGAQEIAEALGITVWAVYGWRRHAMGEKGGSRPSPDRLGAILRLAKGKLSAIDIYPGSQ